MKTWGISHGKTGFNVELYETPFLASLVTPIGLHVVDALKLDRWAYRLYQWIMTYSTEHEKNVGTVPITISTAMKLDPDAIAIVASYSSQYLDAEADGALNLW